MLHPRALATRFESYGAWRKRLVDGVSELHRWLRQQELADTQVDLALDGVQDRLQLGFSLRSQPARER